MNTNKNEKNKQKKETGKTHARVKYNTHLNTNDAGAINYKLLNRLRGYETHFDINTN